MIQVPSGFEDRQTAIKVVDGHLLITFLGRSKVEAPIAVEPGTPVRIGRTVLELRR